MSNAITQEMTNLVKARLGRKDFRTGSRGFFAQDKISVGKDRYQAMVQAVLIGSKDDAEVSILATEQEMKAALADLLKDLAERSFSSGKAGYRVQGKIEVAGQRYQAQCQAVRLA
jgi:hypothetical protein